MRGDVEHYHEPKTFFSPVANRFIQDVLNMDPKQLALKFEAYVVSGLDEGILSHILPLCFVIHIMEPGPVRTSNLSCGKAVSECHQMIQEGLGKLSSIICICKLNTIPDMINQQNGKPGPCKMNYDNYEGKVVERWGVILKGWSGMKGIVNPSKVGGMAEVKTLLKALKNGSCKWERLTEEGLQQRIQDNMARQATGEQVYKGQKVARRKGTKNAKTLEDANEDANEDTEEDVDEDHTS